MSRTSIRQWHSYIGLFIAPSVAFFALTGAVQLFNLHEAHGDYRPPAIVEKLSSVHKDQVFQLGDHHEPAESKTEADKAEAAAAPNAGAKGDDDEPVLSARLLKWFFLLVAVCLTLSTAFGVWMGLTQIRRKGLAWLLLLAGALIPMALIAL